jgi:hypothetical protein
MRWGRFGREAALCMESRGLSVDTRRVSQENVDLIGGLMEAYRNPDVISALADGELDMSLVDPDVEWDASRLSEMIPDLAGVYHGHEGVRTYWRQWFEAWSDLEFDVSWASGRR